jgi:hypothetical protein
MTTTDLQKPLAEATDPAALLTRLEQAKQSRDVWQIGLAEQALEHAAPELAAEVVRLRAENKRLREGLKATQGRVMNVQFGLQTNTTKASAANDLGVIANKIADALKGGEI